jgi:hypothetical protein
LPDWESVKEALRMYKIIFNDLGTQEKALLSDPERWIT